MDRNLEDEKTRYERHQQRDAGFVVVDEPGTGTQSLRDTLRDLWAEESPRKPNKIYARLLGIVAGLGTAWWSYTEFPGAASWQVGAAGVIAGAAAIWILSRVWWLTNLILFVVLASILVPAAILAVSWLLGWN